MADEISLEITNQNSTKDNVVIQHKSFIYPTFSPLAGSTLLQNIHPSERQSCINGIMLCVLLAPERPDHDHAEQLPAQ